MGRLRRSPFLPHPDNNQGNGGANDEEADDGHAPIKVAPPQGAVVACLICPLGLACGLELEVQVARALQSLYHVELLMGR
jgi:hypothetical protein